MRYWMPSRREVVVEVLALLALPGLNIATTIMGGLAPYIVVLLALLTLLITLLIIAAWEWIAQPFRHRILTDKALIDTVDAWLRDNGFGRTPFQWLGFSHAIVAARNNVNVYIGVGAARNTLTIAGVKQESDSDRALLTGTPGLSTRWVDAQFEINLELTRFGVYYETTPTPTRSRSIRRYLLTNLCLRHS